MKDRLRAFCWPHQVERPRTGWLSHFRWIAHMWLLLVFRDRVGLGRAAAVAFDYLEEALTGHPINRILVNTERRPITVTLPAGELGVEYRIKNLGPHPVTVEGLDNALSLEVRGGSAVWVVKEEKSGWEMRRSKDADPTDWWGIAVAVDSAGHLELPWIRLVIHR